MESLPRAMLCSLVLAAPLPDAVHSADRIAGPVEAEILRIVDGDTILVSAKPWPQQSIEVYVRLRGIDTPELRSRCPVDRAAATSARDLLILLVAGEERVSLTDIEGDKYFGRVVADMQLADGSNPAHDLVAAGLAVTYGGGRKPAVVCAVALQN